MQTLRGAAVDAVRRSWTLGLAIALMALGAAPVHAVSLIGTNPVNLPNDTNILDIETSPFLTTTVGQAGVGFLSGLDYQPGTDTLFASGGFGASGSLFTLNTMNGAASLVGATGFDAVPGLAFDLDGTLYGSAAAPGSSFANALIQINVSTGVGTQIGFFGNLGGNIIRGIDGLAIDPTTGILYGSSGFGIGNTPPSLFTIDKTNGNATLLGTLNAPFGLGATLAGLAFDSTGRLFASLGSKDGRILEINVTNLSYSFFGDAAGGSVSGLAVRPGGVVPEPSTAALVGLGLALGVGALRRAAKPAK